MPMVVESGWERTWGNVYLELGHRPNELEAPGAVENAEDGSPKRSEDVVLVFAGIGMNLVAR